MTEAEAKTKWCPMVRAHDWSTISEAIADGCHADAIADAMPVNRQAFDDRPNGFEGLDGYTNPLYRCIGSRCMMWRGATGLDWGYCGLAGKPHI